MNLVHHNKLFPPIWKLGIKWLINSIVRPEGRFFYGYCIGKAPNRLLWYFDFSIYPFLLADYIIINLNKYLSAIVIQVCLSCHILHHVLT